jgi:hypothetical protein
MQSTPRIGTVYEWASCRLIYAVEHDGQTVSTVRELIANRSGTDEVDWRHFEYRTGDPVLEVFGYKKASRARRIARLEARTFDLDDRYEDKAMGDFLREVVNELRHSHGLWTMTLPRR